MKNAIITVLIASLSTTGLISPAGAQMATVEEALNVAINWTTLTIHQKGDWGGSPTAEVQEIQELKRGERVVGYFCHVKPQGHLVVSLRKELAPVKAHSATCNLDPDFNKGMTDLIKGCMERILKGIEEEIGPIESVRPEELEQILEINYRRSWEQFQGDPEIFRRELESGAIKMDYEEGGILLSSSWYQAEPYNDQCPNMECTWFCGSNQNARVGCTATAGAQIMRYWNWPPYGVGIPYDDRYDWPNMPDRLPGCTWPQAEVDAVAELCAEVGEAVGMSYGCDASAVPTSHMEGVYEGNYRYSTACTKRNRSDYSAVNWFNRIKTQLNANRPMHYRVIDHSIVCDGWQVVASDSQYHMNYGRDNAANTWYTLDALLLGDTLTEYMLENIYPAQALGTFLSGTYSLQSFPYRYFDRDAIGISATFQAGQHLHFLPGIVVTSAGTIGFEGTTSNNTLLFSRGDESKGVRIYDGTIKMMTNGGIKFH